MTRWTDGRPDVLIYGDTVRHSTMRHEIPLIVHDPFLYAETHGERHVVVTSLDSSRLQELGGGLIVHAFEEFGLDELLSAGGERVTVRLEIMVRAVTAFGLQTAVVPGDFPLELANLLAPAVTLEVDRQLFETRRRVKSEAEMTGIRRAQAAAEAGMRAGVELLRRAEPGGPGLIADGQPVTCELVKEAIRAAVGAAGANTDDALIVAHGPQTATGHEMGSGPIQPNEPVIIDLWPNDLESACYTDMTRSFVVGEAPAELRKYHQLARESMARSLEAVRPGVAGEELHRLACEPYEQAGLPTQRTKAPGQVLEEGFYHSLGHGVGLEVHEAPLIGRAPDVLMAGDVIVLEPGCYRPGFGGCRLEDLVLVTEDGAELLTDFPYELEP